MSSNADRKQQLISAVLRKKKEKGDFPKGKSAEAVKQRKQAIAIALSEANRKVR